MPLRKRFADLVPHDENKLVSAMIGRYSVGADLGWHKDRPHFGAVIFGLSLTASAEMRFRLVTEERKAVSKLNLERCSAYVMSGEARSLWQHGMQPVKELRYSITMRTLLPPLLGRTITV